MNFVPVRPPGRWRWRRARWIAGTVLLTVVWLAGTAGATAVWWRDNPHPTRPDATIVAVALALVWGGTLALFLPNQQAEIEGGRAMAGKKKTNPTWNLRLLWGSRERKAAKKAAPTKRRKAAR